MGNTLANNQNFCILRRTTNAGATWSTYTASLDTLAWFGSGPDTLPYTDHVRSNVDLYWASQHFTPTNSYFNNQFNDGQTEKFQRLIIPATAFNGGGPVLTIVIEPASGLPGGVESSPSGISCGMNPEICQASFSGNVSLTATPLDGWSFSHWVDGGTNYSENPKTFSVTAAKTVKAVFRLFSFPLAGYTPYTVPTSSVFDHAATAQYTADADHRVMTFNGEVSIAQNPKPGTTCYPKSDNSAFGLGFNYVGYGQDPYYLCYDGHPGYDYAVNLADVYSAASGTVQTIFIDPAPDHRSTCFGNYVVINHPGGYTTKYFHLASIDEGIQEGSIGSGVKIGVSGNTGYCSDGAHLHFQVEKNGVPVDPYGWTGSGADPYTRATNDVLWK
jgi:hypothetical protein